VIERDAIAKENNIIQSI